jgi:hypothetical protein
MTPLSSTEVEAELLFETDEDAPPRIPIGHRSAAVVRGRDRARSRSSRSQSVAVELVGVARER